MTEHYTKNEFTSLLLENGLDRGARYHLENDTLHALINTAVTRKLAEKELEVVRLRDFLKRIEYLSMECGVENLATEALSTPSSTKHLDEYVAGKTQELKQKCGEFAEESLKNAAKLAAAEDAHDKASKEFNAAINHAISLGLDASVFLHAWREGNWKGCKEFSFERGE